MEIKHLATLLTQDDQLKYIFTVRLGYYFAAVMQIIGRITREWIKKRFDLRNKGRDSNVEKVHDNNAWLYEKQQNGNIT